MHHSGKAIPCDIQAIGPSLLTAQSLQAQGCEYALYEPRNMGDQGTAMQEILMFRYLNPGHFVHMWQKACLSVLSYLPNSVLRRSVSGQLSTPNSTWQLSGIACLQSHTLRNR